MAEYQTNEPETEPETSPRPRRKLPLVVLAGGAH